jgi:hypothetical protein
MEGLLCTPPEIRELAEMTTQSLLPDKSETAFWRTLRYSAKNTNHQLQLTIMLKLTCNTNIYNCAIGTSL